MDNWNIVGPFLVSGISGGKNPSKLRMLKDLKKKLVVIAGPTAVGKTAVAIIVARHFGTEVVSADSRQFFQELKIGTAKPDDRQLEEVRHHFIDRFSIRQEYDAAQFGRDALDVIHAIFRHGDHAVLCGGSGLYIKAVCEGFDDIPEVSGDVRRSLMNEYGIHGLPWLQERMNRLDPDHYGTIDSQNPHRLIRALEVKIGTGMSISSFRKKEKIHHDFDIVKIGLELPREELYDNIDKRMDEMIASGLFAEAESLYPFRDHQALQTVGYQEIFGYLEKAYDRDEAIRMLKRNSRRYAKRQLTWFKRDPEIKWFSPHQVDMIIEYIASRN